MSVTIFNKPVFKPEISFQTKVQENVEQATILHCQLTQSSYLRIWPNTVLIQNDGVSKHLIQAYNIPEFPTWKYVSTGHVFTLVFEGLDKDCTEFELLEDIPEPGGLMLKSIHRNHTDVYNITM